VRWAIHRSRPLLAFDYDGTLAPIVSDPARAAVRTGTRELLTRLRLDTLCVVVSGRPRRDLVRRLAAWLAEAIAITGSSPGTHRPARHASSGIGAGSSLHGSLPSTA